MYISYISFAELVDRLVRDLGGYVVPVKAAGKSISRSEKVMQNLASAGHLPFPATKVGGRWLVHVEDLAAYIIGMRAGAGPAQYGYMANAEEASSNAPPQAPRRRGRPRKFEPTVKMEGRG